MSKILVLLVIISVSVAVLFSLTQASQYLTIIPGGSHAHNGSDAPDSPRVSEDSTVPKGQSKQWDVDEWPVTEAPPAPMRNNRRFVVIVPATSPDPNLCKMVLSAMALGYPSPIIVGWGMDYRSVTKWDGGPNLIKVPAVLGYLDSVLRHDAHPSEKLEHDDIVLIADAFDVWFQLPPEVLLKRYHAINEQAITRLREQWHGKGHMPLQQTIVAGSEKNCWPRPSVGSNIQCPSLPDSPIREDLYGTETDKNQTDRHNLRPRYINGGVYIGQANDVRRWFRRASNIMMEGINNGKKLRSEQGLTGQVFGEQEIWRQWRRDNAETKNEPIASTLIQRDFEYHIGLDYFQVLSAQTHDAGNDGRIVVLSNQTDIDRHSAELNISPVRLRGIPDDVRTAQNPLENLIERPDWGEMPLYVDFYTESVAVILHHNGKGPGQKKRRKDWWALTWYFKYLRRLVQRRLMPGEPALLATVETENGIITYRPLDAEKLGKKPRIMRDLATERLIETEFDAICGAPNEPWWDEVFRDGQGNLV
ncbi:Fc.00g056500.m01.CDS01 [Cosmosporella sp. VM-42]